MSFHLAPQARALSVCFNLSDGTKVLREVKGWRDRLDKFGDPDDLIAVPMVADGAILLSADRVAVIGDVDVVSHTLVEGSVGTALDAALGVDEAHEALAEQLPPAREVVPQTALERARGILELLEENGQEEISMSTVREAFRAVLEALESPEAAES